MFIICFVIESQCMYVRTGINLLLFTFPVMFIAALGCIYLHVHSKSDNKPFTGRYATRDNLWIYLSL